MALKGTAVIELTNIKTGEKERYVEHNLITKALEYMHQPIGGLKLPQTNTGSDINDLPYESILGGLVLWDKAIEENDAIVTKPAGIRMVGCAAHGKVNTTTSACRGSYNATESYFTNSSVETSMKFVYDFTTSQANGTINCISLTNWKAGWNGFGGNEILLDTCASKDNYSGSNLGYATDTGYWFFGNANSPANLLYVDPEEDVFYQVASVNTGSVVIAKRRANIHQRSMFGRMYVEHPLIESITVDLPSTMTGAYYYFSNYDADSDTAYIVVGPSSSTIASGGTFYVIEINMATYEATLHTVKNPRSASFYLDHRYIVCHKGYLYYAYGGLYSVYKVSLDDSSYSLIHIPIGYVYSSDMFILLANGAIYFHIQGKADNGSNYERTAVLFADDNEIRITGSSHYPYGYDNYRRCFCPIKGNPLLFYYPYTYSSSSNSATAYKWLDTNYLATINNLARPIEKTSDKTMKITYTIQEM